MNRLTKHLYSCLSLILLFSTTSKALDNTPNNFIDYTSQINYLNYIDSFEEKSLDSLLQIEEKRHELITQLDKIFNDVYSIWLDSKQYKQLLDVNNLDKNRDVLSLLFKSSSLKKIDYTLEEFVIYLDQNDHKLLSIFRWKLLFKALNVDYNCKSEVAIKENISCLKYHATLQAIGEEYRNRLENYPLLTHYAGKRNLNYFEARLTEVEEKEFVHYKSENDNRTAFKGINITSANDFFVLPNKINQDRDLTGGGRIDIVTDFFSSEFFNTIRLKESVKSSLRSRIMEYRTLGLGMDFYTPYIRYRDNRQLADTLFTYDRPFSSYVYVHRTEYRLWPRSRVRSKSSFQIGIMGSNWEEIFKQHCIEMQS